MLVRRVIKTRAERAVNGVTTRVFAECTRAGCCSDMAHGCGMGALATVEVGPGCWFMAAATIACTEGCVCKLWLPCAAREHAMSTRRGEL